MTNWPKICGNGLRKSYSILLKSWLLATSVTDFVSSTIFSVMKAFCTVYRNYDGLRKLIKLFERDFKVSTTEKSDFLMP